jgi:hypothetical protein
MKEKLDGLQQKQLQGDLARGRNAINVERRGGTSKLGVSLEEDNFELLHFSIKS